MLGIILQARMGSSRLPGKVLKSIGSKTLLAHIFFRLQFLQHKAKLVVATSNAEQDDNIVDYCLDYKIDCFRGSEVNVLERYYFCAKEFGFEHIVRLTGDNPFIDIEELDKLIDFHLLNKADYTHSFGQLPLGVGSEIFTYSSLEKSYQCADKPNHFEHVNEYITDFPEQFRICTLTVMQKKISPNLRLTVDTELDYKRACYIVEKSCNEYVTTEEAIRLCMQFV